MSDLATLKALMTASANSINQPRRSLADALFDAQPLPQSPGLVFYYKSKYSDRKSIPTSELPHWIIINGHRHPIWATTVSYADIIKLIGGSVIDVYSVTYQHATDERCGCLYPGLEITIKDGTRFSALVTGAA